MKPLKNCTQTFENLLNSVHLRETKGAHLNHLELVKLNKKKGHNKKQKFNNKKHGNRSYGTNKNLVSYNKCTNSYCIN